MRNSITKALLVLLASLASVALLLASCVPPYGSVPPSDIPNLTSHNIVHAGAPLHYVEAGSPGKPLVVFIHGTPGTWQAFREFLLDPTLAANTHMIAIDRPGLGESATRGPQPDFAIQAQAIAQLLKHNTSNAGAIVVGHSLGGSIAFRCAVDYPAQIAGLLAISSSIDPTLGEPRWFNQFAAWPLVRWLVRGDLGIANLEIMQLHTQLRQIEAAMQALDIPITVIQGGSDLLVSPANARYASENLQSSKLKVITEPDAGHFLIWEQPELVVDAILDLVAQTEPS